LLLLLSVGRLLVLLSVGRLLVLLRGGRLLVLLSGGRVAGKERTAVTLGVWYVAKPLGTSEPPKDTPPSSGMTWDV
jgi:hypothetical protein